MFKYRYEKILSFKEDVYKEKQRELSIAIKKREEDKVFLENLVLSYQNFLTSKEEKLKKGIVSSDIKMWQMNTSYFEEEIEIATKNLEKSSKKAEKAREILFLAMQEKKKYEKLKEKVKEDYRLRLLEKEKQNIDEIISYRSVI